MILTYNTGTSASLIVSAIFKEKETSVMLAPLIVLTSQLFAGFIINLKDMPFWLS